MEKLQKDNLAIFAEFSPKSFFTYLFIKFKDFNVQDRKFGVHFPFGCSGSKLKNLHSILKNQSDSINIYSTRDFIRHKMFKLVLLAGMGLGALYMMHLLAQDYNKIRQPVAAAARALASASNVVTRVKRDTPDAITQSPRNATTLSIDWKRILSRDPFECLQSLICQLASGAESQSHEAKLLIEFVEATVDVAPVTIQRAFSKGLVLRGATDQCYNEYPFCVYSARTMLRVLRWFAESTIDEET